MYYYIRKRMRGDGDDDARGGAEGSMVRDHGQVMMVRVISSKKHYPLFIID